MISWTRARLFHGTVVKEDRSLMNVPFVTGDKDLDAKFVKAAKRGRLCRTSRDTGPLAVCAQAFTMRCR